MTSLANLHATDEYDTRLRAIQLHLYEVSREAVLLADRAHDAHAWPKETQSCLMSVVDRAYRAAKAIQDKSAEEVTRGWLCDLVKSTDAAMWYTAGNIALATEAYLCLIEFLLCVYEKNELPTLKLERTSRMQEISRRELLVLLSQDLDEIKDILWKTPREKLAKATELREVTEQAIRLRPIIWES